MKYKWAILALLVVCLFMVSRAAPAAIDTREIDLVRNKGVLDPGTDFAIIDSFVDSAVRELLKSRDFSDVAKVRKTVLDRAGSRKQSAQAQYGVQFFESAQKHVPAAFALVAVQKPESRRFLVTVNLLILVEGLLQMEGVADLRLADLAIDNLKNANAVVQYLAVRSITNPGFTTKLKDNPKLAARISGQFAGLVSIGSCDALKLIARFGGNVKVPEAEKLLLQVADLRIEKYSAWEVHDEVLDGEVLKSLVQRISSPGSSSAGVGRRIGQLYSYILQMYVKDLNGGHFLSKQARRQTVSVLVEIERSCVSKLLGRSQAVIKQAIERNDISGLQAEHDSLFGSETKTG
ncbi:MAG: hypothetical protein ACYS29_15930, partial [Planctomycetota bacterium]